MSQPHESHNTHRSPGPDAGTQSNNQTTENNPESYEEFIRMGDMTLDDSNSSEGLGPSPSSSRQRTADSGHSNNTATPNNPSVPSQTNGQHDHGTSSFFTFIRKATTTLENSFQSAHQNSSEALSSAQQHVTAASTSAYSTMSGIVHDIGTTFNPPSAPGSTGYPPTTLALKALRLPPTATPLAIIPGLEPTVATHTSVYRFFPNAPAPSVTPLTFTRPQSNTSSDSVAEATIVPVQATHAANFPDSRVAVSHEDGSVLLFSLFQGQGNEGIQCASAPPHPSPTTALAPMLPNGVAIARRDGSVHLLNASLQPIVSLPAPLMCSTPLTPMLSSAAPIALAPVSQSAQIHGVDGALKEQPAIAVAYDDGTITCFTKSGGKFGSPFVAHAGPPGGITTLFGGIIIVSLGNESDKTIAVFDALSGRCLTRRALSFVPKFVTKITQNVLRHSPDTPTCPSESTILVAGDEGKIEAFRVVVISPWKVDVKFVLRVGDKSRGKKRGVVDMNYMRFNGVLTIVYEGGEIRRWQLSKEDASLLSRLQEDVNTGATFTQANIEHMMEDEDNSDEQPISHGVTGVIRAQTILASLLEDASIGEEKKDELAGTFQKRQARMVSALSEAETKGRRARRRVFGQFFAGVKAKGHASSTLEHRLEIETRRAAALEAELLSRKYTSIVRHIESETVAKLQDVLKQFLNSLSRNDSLIVNQARRDVEILGTEDEDLEVD